MAAGKLPLVTPESDATTRPRAHDNDAGADESVTRVTGAYFDAWKTHDWTALRSALAEDVTFRGPLGTADNREECIAGLQRMSRIVTDIVVQQVFLAGADVLTWYDLHTTVAPPSPTANWSHVVNGEITAIRATFDARPFQPPRQPQT